MQKVPVFLIITGCVIPGFFRHLLVRKAVKTGEILIDLVTTTEEGDREFDGHGFAEALLELELEGNHCRHSPYKKRQCGGCGER